MRWRTFLGRLAASGAVLVSAGGCFSSVPEAPQTLSSLRQGAVHSRLVEIEIPKSRYLTALSRGNSLAGIRIVQVYRRESMPSGGLPEYRLFDIDPLSPYALLGLKTADILLATNDYLIYNPEAFRLAVGQLHRESEAWIDLVRDGEPIQLRYRFTEG